MSKKNGGTGAQQPLIKELFTVHILREPIRGCGYRSSGAGGVGIYLMCYGFFEACERLPFPLGDDLKFSRLYQVIDPSLVFAPEKMPKCNHGPGHRHGTCKVCSPNDTAALLLWAGRASYPNPSDFVSEAMAMGISRRISGIPQGVDLNNCMAYIAHLDGCPGEADGEYAPGVFMAMKPTHIDLVIDDENEIPAKAIEIKKKLGDLARIVKVIPDA